jgi:gluconate 2-dehydrogenase gamma chain
MHSVADGVIDRREAVQRVALLLGAALSAPAFKALLARGAAAAHAPAGFTPRALSPEQLEQVATIAEHIIPATDTPGARAAGVHRFIDTMLAEYYSSAEREHLLIGLAGVDARARRSFGRAFLNCKESDQRALLEQLDHETFGQPTTSGTVANEASRETERGGGGLATQGTDASRRVQNARRGSFPPFFRTMKDLTLLGYYTSQPGATKELRYVQVPGRFDGCVPVAKGGRTWAT